MSTAEPTLPPTPPMPIDEPPVAPPPSLPSVAEPEPAPAAVPEQTTAVPATTVPVAAAIGGEKTRPSPYRQIFPDLVQAYERRRFGDIVRLAEEAEVMYPELKERPTRLLITIPLVLSYLCVDDLPPARWALARLPRVLQTFAPTRALQELLAAVANRDYANVYAAANNLVTVTTGSLKGEDELDLTIKPMVDAFIQTYQAGLLSVLSRAYASLPVSDAAAYLGKSPEEAIAACTSLGWVYDASTSALRPAPAKTQQNGAPVLGAIYPSVFAQSSLIDFDGIANGAAQLESVV